jgi:hypothetical protein
VTYLIQAFESDFPIDKELPVPNLPDTFSLW